VPEDYLLNLSPSILTFSVFCYFFETSDEDVVLSHCSRFPPLSVVSSLIRRTLEFQYINDLVGPIYHNRIRPPFSNDDLIVWVCSIPIHPLVALQFFIIMSFFHGISRAKLRFASPCLVMAQSRYFQHLL
jgi:hypothetical protein